jgi:hypothetical protein
MLIFVSLWRLHIGTTRLNERMAAFELAKVQCDDLGVPLPHPHLEYPPLFRADVIAGFESTQRKYANSNSAVPAAPPITTILEQLFDELQVWAAGTDSLAASAAQLSGAAAAAHAQPPPPYINLRRWTQQCRELPADIEGRVPADVARQLLMANVSTTNFAEVLRDRNAFSPPTAWHIHFTKVVGALQYPVHISTSGAYDAYGRRDANDILHCPTFGFLGRAVSESKHRLGMQR